MNAELTGVRPLVHLGLRRDRLMIPVWVYALAATAVSTAYSYRGLYKTVAARLEFAEGVRANVSTLALYGHVYAPSTVGGLTTWRIGTTGAVLGSVLSVLLVVRHSRADEEAGRTELVGSLPVARRAPLTAAVLIASLAQAGLAVLTAVGLIAAGLPVAGAVAFGLAWLTAGSFFAAVAAVAAQLAQSARTANTVALSVLGAAYLLRAIGDAGPSWVSWLSPIGWAEQVRPFAADRWWVLPVPAAGTALVLVVAMRLAAHRDLGGGLLAIRSGPAVGGPRLGSPLALAWRLQRAGVAAWTVGLGIYAAAIGGIADGVGALVNSSSGTRDIIIKMGGRHGLVDAFLATAMGILGLAAAAYVVQALSRLRAEENDHRAELVLAASVSRWRWVASHAAITLAGSAVMLAVAGAAAGTTHGIRAHDLSGQLPRVLGAALAQLPAVWVLGGAALLLFGFWPRAVTAAWALLAACMLLGQLGPVLGLPGWAQDLSPFTHLPKLPGGTVTLTPLIGLIAAVAVLGAAGFAAVRHRDIG